MPTYTTNFNLAKPIVNDPIDEDLWGTELNSNMDIIDAALVTLPVADTTAIVKGSVDATKLLRFEVDGFTTGTTRVLTPPNFDGTIATRDGSETYNNKLLVDSTVSFVDQGDTTKRLAFQCSSIATGTTRTATAPDISGNLLLDVARSLGSNGYVTLSNGLILQWGRTGSISAGAGTAVSFPIAFPAAVFIAIATGDYTGNTSTGTTETTLVKDGTLTTSGVTFVRGGTSSNPAYWFAIGN